MVRKGKGSGEGEGEVEEEEKTEEKEEEVSGWESLLIPPVAADTT